MTKAPRKPLNYTPRFLTELLEPYRTKLSVKKTIEGDDPERDRIESIEMLLRDITKDTTLHHALHQYKGTEQKAYLVGNSSDVHSLYMTPEGKLVFNESGTQYNRTYELREKRTRILKRLEGYEFICIESSIAGIHKGDRLNIEKDFGQNSIRGYEKTTAESMLDRLKECLQEMVYKRHGYPEETPPEPPQNKGPQKRRIYRNKQPMREPDKQPSLRILPGGRK